MSKKLELMVELMYVMGQFDKNLTAEKTAEMIDKAKFYGMMQGDE